MNENKGPNGTLILVMGIVGFLCCTPLGIAAWIMGNNALRDLDRGIGDPNQRGLVVAGRILGILSVVFSIVGCLLGIFLNLL